MLEQFIINSTLFVGIILGIIMAGVTILLIQRFNITKWSDLTKPVNILVVSSILLYTIGVPYTVQVPLIMEPRWLANPTYFVALLIAIIWLLDLDDFTPSESSDVDSTEE